MSYSRTQALTLAVAGCAALFSDQAAAQRPADAVFAAPVRIKAGEAFLGEGRLYPSPVFYDVDGDERADVVVGDLFGRVTSAARTANQSTVAFGADKPLKDRSGEQLKFHNW